MAKRNDVIVLHDLKVADFASSRQKAKGRTKNVILIEADPIFHDFDDMRLGKGPAMALETLIKDEIKGQTDKVKPSTLKRRQQYERALENGAKKGKSGAHKHYSGGRTGPTPANADGQGRWLNDSGRMANGIRTREVRKVNGWVTNVPANRLRPELFGKNFQYFLSEFQRRVNVKKLTASGDFRKAVEASLEDLIAVGKASLRDKQWQLLMKRLGLVRTAAKAIASIG